MSPRKIGSWPGGRQAAERRRRQGGAPPTSDLLGEARRAAGRRAGLAHAAGLPLRSRRLRSRRSLRYHLPARPPPPRSPFRPHGP